MVIASKFDPIDEDIKLVKYPSLILNAIKVEIKGALNEFLGQKSNDILEQIEQDQKKIDVSWHAWIKKTDVSWHISKKDEKHKENSSDDKRKDKIDLSPKQIK